MSKFLLSTGKKNIRALGYTRFATQSEENISNEDDLDVIVCSFFGQTRIADAIPYINWCIAFIFLLSLRGSPIYKDHFVLRLAVRNLHVSGSLIVCVL